MRSLDRVPFWTTPSAPLKEASRLLLDVASTPPRSGGEWHGQSIQLSLTRLQTLLGQAPDTGGVAAPSRKRCEAALINAARYRACASRAAQTGWSGLKKCFRMRSLKEAPTIDHY